MLGLERKVGFGARLVRITLLLAVLVSLGAAFPVASSANRQIARSHNFIAPPVKSKAAGICDVCHAAGDLSTGTGARIFRYPGADDIAKCGQSCHASGSVAVYVEPAINVTP
ncbi:hypothetical protein FDZ71_09730, partial [bacterium]